MPQKGGGAEQSHNVEKPRHRKQGLSIFNCSSNCRERGQSIRKSTAFGSINSTSTIDPRVLRRQSERLALFRELGTALRRVAILATEAYQLSPRHSERERLIELKKRVNLRLSELLQKIERESHSVR